MNEVLTFFRDEIDPRFKDVPDNKLAEFIYNEYPQFLKDPGFRSGIKEQFAVEANVPSTTPDFVSDEARQRGRISSAGQSAMRGGGVGTGGTVSTFGRFIENLAPYFAGMDPSGQGLAIPDMEQAQAAYAEQQRKEKLTPLQRELEIQQNPIYQAGQQIAGGAREAFQPNPKYAGEFFADVLPSSAGGMVPTFAASMLAGPVGGALKLPFAGTAVGALQYGGAASESVAEDAINAGRIDLANRAAALAFPVAAISEGVLGAATRFGSKLLRPAESAAARVAGNTAEDAATAAAAAAAEQRLLREEFDLLRKGVGRRIGEVGLREAGQESIEQVGENVIASTLAPYDPQRGLFQGVPESAAAGFLLGGAVGGAEVGLDVARRRGQESRLNNAYQNALNQLASRSFYLGTDGAVYGTPFQQPVAQISPIGGLAQTYAGEGISIGPSGTRISNAERRRLEQEALTQAAPTEPSVPEEVVTEQRVGQYPPEGMGTGVIPSQQELERRAERRRQVAERNRAEAESRRAEAFGELAANPQEEARIMAQLVAEEAAARAKAEEDDRRIMAGLEVEQAAAVLRQQEEAAAQVSQQPTQQVREETIQVPEARQPVVQEGGQGAQGVGRLDRPTEVRKGAVPADVAGGAQVAPGLSQLIDEVDDASLNLESPSKLRALTKNALKLGFITQADHDEVLRVQRDVGSRDDTTDAFRELQTTLEIRRTNLAKTAPAVAPAVAQPAAPLLAQLPYADGGSVSDGDKVQLRGSALGPEISKKLGATKIFGTAAKNADGSVTITVTDAGVTKPRGGKQTRAQSVRLALQDRITFTPLPNGMTRVERVSSAGENRFDPVEIRLAGEMFSKVAAAPPAAAAQPAAEMGTTASTLQRIFSVYEDPRFNRFQELFDADVRGQDTEDGAAEFAALKRELGPELVTLMQAAYYRQVGPGQIRQMLSTRLRRGITVDDAEIENEWDKKVTQWVEKRLTPEGADQVFGLRTIQRNLSENIAQKAERRGPAASSLAPEGQEESLIPEPAAGMGPEAVPTAQTSDLGEATASTAAAEEALLNQSVFEELAIGVAAAERRLGGKRLSDDQLLAAARFILFDRNQEILDAIRQGNEATYNAVIADLESKILAIYKQGGSKLFADIADGFQSVGSLLSRPWPSPTGLPAAEVQQYLESKYGIRPGSGFVSVVSIPGADFNGRLFVLKSTGEPIALQINAATVSSLAEVDKVLRHEWAEMALAQGIAREVLSQISPNERAEIVATVQRLGYDPSNATEVDARVVEQLAAAYRNRNWFQRLVANVLAWANSKGLKLTRLAAELIAARAVATAQTEAINGVRKSDAGDYTTSSVLQSFDAKAAELSGLVEARESKTTFTKREGVTEELGQPGLLTSQQDIIEASAAAQAAVVPANIKQTITAAGLSPRSRAALSWLGKVFDLSTSPKPLSSLNPDDSNTMQIASAVTGQVDRVRKNRSDLIIKLEKLREKMLSPRRAQILSELATANAAANAAGAASEGLTKDFRAYNRQEILTYAGTDASLKNAVTKASDAIRLLYTESKEINKAFEVMAENVPDAVIAQAKTLGNNQPIFDYVINSKMLDGKVSKSVIDALTIAPATGKLSPLQSYRGLSSALRTIKDYKADVSKAKADRKAFEALFAATSPSTTAKAKRVDIEDYARRYRALRNAEQDAVDRIRSLSREIEALDNALLDTIEQIAVLDSVMGSAEYADSANTASNLLNLFTPEILGVPDPNGVRHVVGGTPYVIPSKFDPETDRDAAGQVLSLSNAVNARLSQIASGTEPVDPVERRTLEHLRLKLQQFAGNTAGNAALRIGPFNPARLRRKIPILRSLISRRHLARIIPGRLSGELNMLNAAGDSLEKALDGQARRDKTVGINALNVATSRALASHPGLDPLVWKTEVLNEILNSNQKDTDFRVTAGMTTPFGHTVTKEDIDAAKLQARFGHKVYSVSTAKDRGGVLRFFPNMIMEGNRLRLPFVTGAMTTPRRLVRDEVEGGPVYYAKQIEQALENPDEASRKAEIERILNEPNAFTLMARRYVWETNSEFKNRSPYAKVYRKLAVDWWTNKTAAPTNIDELVDQIAGLVPGTANTQQEVRDSLINEIVAVSKASLESQRTSIQEAGEYVKNGVGDEGFSAEVFSPSAVVSVVDSFNQFTKPRGDMVAPGSFYDYTLATDESQNALIVAAMMPLRIRQLRALMDLQRELMKHKTNLAQRMNLDPQSVKQDLNNGKLYLELSEVSELLQVLSDALETFKSRVSAPNIAVDNGLLRAWNAVHKALLVNALTAATGNILFGIAGGDTAARVMTRGYTPRTGISTLAAGPRVLLNIVERAFASNPDAVRFIKKNRSKLGALGARMMRQAELYAEIEAAARRGGWRVDEETAAERAAQVAEVGGFRSPIRGRGELRDSLLNRIERKLSNRAIVRVKEALFRFQPAGDEVANDLNAKTALTNLTLLFQAGYNIIKNRAASGVPNWDNWTDPNNFIRPEEAKQVAGWSPEILFWLKENMAPAGSLEYLLHDYYKRVEAAKAAGTDPEAVAPLADEDALADVMIRILSASNLPADSSRADLIRSSSGMGQALSFFWGFPGWINNWLDSLEGFSSISTERRSQLERLALPVIYTMALAALLSLSGLWPNELLALFYELVNGRPYNVMTAREFASAPTPAALGKLLAVSLARMVPYAGEYIAGYVGATQNKPSMTDLSKMSIPLGVLANFSNALETAWKTGDIAGAALGLTRSSLPILNPILNRIAPQGRDAINDAVRVATRNAGDLEIKTRPGGGGFEPTEFSSLIKRAVAANANGDTEGAKALLQRAADVKAKSGVADPWSAVKSSLKAQAPDFKAFGRTISEGERAGLLGRMSASQSGVYQTAENAVSSLVATIGTKAQREAAAGGGGGGLVAAQRQIRAITGTPKPIKAIRKQLRSAMPKGLKLKRSRGTRLGTAKLRTPKGTSVASLSSSRLLRQGLRPTAALGRASREQRRRVGAGLPLGPMTYGGMPSVARGY